jgi:Family of unknown function (DUF6152)
MVRSRLVISFVVFATVLLYGGTLSAHHGSAAYAPATSTVSGTIVEFEFVNPHCQLHVDAKDDQGNLVHWTGEFTNPAALHRRGWSKEMFKAGETVTVTGNKAKSGAPFMRVMKVQMADGKELTAFGGEDDN